MSNNKIALLTGGSRGLGRDMAVNLSKKGIDVIFTYHTNEAAANEVINEIEHNGQKAKAFQLDTSDVGQFDEFFTSLGAELISVWPDYLLLPLASDSDLSTPDPAHLDNSAEPANLGFHASMLLSTETQLVR